MKIGWWSAGITSAVACKIAIEIYEDVKLFYIETGAAHPDNDRFKRECEQWYGQSIDVIRNSKGFKSPIDVIDKTKYVNGPGGARCTLELKKEVRYELEAKFPDFENQVFGYEWDQRQVNRAIRFIQQYPNAKGLFPLIERRLDKNNCAGMLQSAGIELPAMYELGYPNNNCIGCVKGGMGYWNKIRKDFPERFKEMAEAERRTGHSCIKDKFLDTLHPNAGRKSKIIMPNCGNFCEVEFADIPVKDIEKVMSGEISIYEAA